MGQMGCLDHGTKRRSSRDGRYCRWVGGSFAVRREAFKQVGLYDVRLSGGGGPPRSEDTELFWRFMEHGLVVCYEPAAVAYHQIGSERMTPAYFRHLYRRSGSYNAVLVPWKPSHLFTVMPLWRTWVTCKVVTAWVWSVLTWRPWLERFKAELLVREEASLWARRLQLWPRWWLMVLGGRRGTPSDAPRMDAVDNAASAPIRAGE